MDGAALRTREPGPAAAQGPAHRPAPGRTSPGAPVAPRGRTSSDGSRATGAPRALPRRLGNAVSLLSVLSWSGRPVLFYVSFGCVARWLGVCVQSPLTAHAGTTPRGPRRPSRTDTSVTSSEPPRPPSPLPLPHSPPRAPSRRATVSSPSVSESVSVLFVRLF